MCHRARHAVRRHLEPVHGARRVARRAVDVLIQSVIAFGCTGKPDRFPVGTDRFETISIIIASWLMSICALFTFHEAAVRLYDGVVHDTAEPPDMAPVTLAIVCSCIGAKSIAGRNQEGHLNDVVSNVFAVVAFALSASYPSLWYIDPVGSIFIFVLVLVSWSGTTKEQILRLMAVRADAAVVEAVHAIVNIHNVRLGALRANHAGTKCVVELDIIVAETMSVGASHAIALGL
ncbi:Aste57867_25175 [Aphanomyces stellatus]|uniref:Aste57867_25175 protein n=1 Tax=Aphanomyces stellatus TaxID=120398 RepID=A0A485LUU4_9STRA|nr:hypothetical protein As57867_025097 [Aphanomyces stellatus]VFU01804.1 Aste57867_25175 [Aphanomyces stellatus]